MKKKFLSVILLLVFVLLFSGCGNNFDNYSIKKDVKIKETLNETEIDDLKKEYIKTIDNYKKVEILYKLDISGDIENTNIEINIVINNEDIKDPELELILKNNSKIVKDNETISSKSIASYYYKDGYLYTDINGTTKTEKDGKVNKEEIIEKYKEKNDGKFNIDNLGSISADITALIGRFDYEINYIETSNGEIGKDKNNNIVFQLIDKNENGKRECTSRIVFKDGVPFYVGEKTKEFMNHMIINEIGFYYNQGSIDFPDFSSYEEKK